MMVVVDDIRRIIDVPDTLQGEEYIFDEKDLMKEFLKELVIRNIKIGILSVVQPGLIASREFAVSPCEPGIQGDLKKIDEQLIKIINDMKVYEIPLILRKIEESLYNDRLMNALRNRLSK